MTSRWIIHLILGLAAVASLAFSGGAEADIRVGSNFRDGFGVGACADARVLWVDPDRTCVWVGWTE